MMSMIILAVDVLLVLALLYVDEKIFEAQDEQECDIDSHEDRLDALEDYADYIREELMSLKRRENADNDRADNYVRWRRKPERIVAGD